MSLTKRSIKHKYLQHGLSPYNSSMCKYVELCGGGWLLAHCGGQTPHPGCCGQSRPQQSAPAHASVALLDPEGQVRAAILDSINPPARYCIPMCARHHHRSSIDSNIVRISFQHSHRIPYDILTLAKNWSVHTYVLLSTYSIEMQATRALVSSCCTMCHSSTMLQSSVSNMCLGMLLSYKPLTAQAAGTSGEGAAGLHGCLVRLPQRREQSELRAVGRQPASEQAGSCLKISCWQLRHGGLSIRSQSWEGGNLLWPLLSLHLCGLLLAMSKSLVLAPFEPCCGVQGGI